ncbi:Stress response protein SCP2 [Actinacidiphila yanglinensis]|uniref:Stress response protein SCP2 n=1 Tax=Actinacidiphila yanglinensis TaxID=310779 RepID=A0A1H5ZX66_9ACTN|nr:VWA domain-containing protein [Actinacidiphila yanglinensis]SEG41093.1 Stress response protein SCP2 [Actinacidiphila yanglinensis]
MAGAISLTPGGNTALTGDRARAEVAATGPAVDVSAVLLAENRKVRDDTDLVFYNHPAQDGVSVQGQGVAVDLPRVPPAVQTVAVVVSVDANRPGAVFDGASGLRVTVTSGDGVISFEPPPCRLGETVVVLAEFYRRAGAWKVRAVGQGYADGLAGLARDFGVSVDDEPAAAAPPAPSPPTVPDAVLSPPTLQTPSPAQQFGPPPDMGRAPAGTGPAHPGPAAAPPAWAPPPPGAAPAQLPPPAPWAPPVAPPPAAPPAPPRAAPPMPAQAPAISLEKVERAAPALVNLYKQAGISLQKQGITGQRAAVYLVLDHSASMKSYYRSGTMQHLANQVLGLSANLDDDGVVPVVFFSSRVDLVSEISLDNHADRVEVLHRKLPWGGTCYAPAMRAVIDHYQQCGATDPAFVVFQTDGEPFDRGETKRLLQQTCTLPIFWQFVGFGNPRGLKFLRGLDTLKGRAIDNAGFFAAGHDPRERGDAELYDCLMSEFPSWLKTARAARVIR